MNKRTERNFLFRNTRENRPIEFGLKKIIGDYFELLVFVSPCAHVS